MNHHGKQKGVFCTVLALMFCLTACSMQNASPAIFNVVQPTPTVGEIVIQPTPAVDEYIIQPTPTAGVIVHSTPVDAEADNSLPVTAPPVEHRVGDVQDEAEVMGNFRRYIAQDHAPYPDWYDDFFEEDESLQRERTDLTPYGDFVVQYDMNSATATAVSMGTLQPLNDFDLDAKPLFIHARLQFLQCPETYVFTYAMLHDAGITSYPLHAEPFTTERSVFLAAAGINNSRKVPDRRKQVADTQQAPYDALCRLEMTWPRGDTFTGTGWLINPNTVVTAGSALYQPSLGGWPVDVSVIPAVNGENTAVNTYKPIRLTVGGAWYANCAPDDNWGAVRIDADIDLPGYWPMQAATDTQLRRLRAN